MRLKQYLITEGRSKPINVDDANEYIQKKCSKFYYGYKNNTLPYLYRGLNGSSTHLIVDPTKHVRVSSQSNLNYTTLMVDNLKSWNKYPKRSQSLICSTSSNYSSQFGGYIYIVYPSDKCNLGICNNPDIWSSFQKTLGVHNGVPDLNKEIELMIRTVSNKTPDTSFTEFKKMISLVDDKFNNMFKKIRSLDISDNRKQVRISSYFRNVLTKITTEPIFELWLNEEFRKGHDINIMKKLETIVTPKGNGFSTILSNMYQNNEVWVGGGECILIDVNYVGL